MTPFRFLLVLMIKLCTSAFIPQLRTPAFSSKTALQFQFLKDLGLEKPSWLPDFGGGKEEEPKAEEAKAEEEKEKVEAEAAKDE